MTKTFNFKTSRGTAVTLTATKETFTNEIKADGVATGIIETTTVINYTATINSETMRCNIGSIIEKGVEYKNVATMHTKKGQYLIVAIPEDIFTEVKIVETVETSETSETETVSTICKSCGTYCQGDCNGVEQVEESNDGLDQIGE